MSKKYLIALDAGHGANTAGKRTPPLTEDLYINGKLVRRKGEVIKEHEFNKATVEYLATALKRCGFDVLLVAPEDTDISLSTRVKRANNAKADAYISKHYNALGNTWQTKASGAVTIIHENCSSTSKKLAQNVHSEMITLHNNHNCINYGVRVDTQLSGHSLYVLKNTKMPAILTESGFMDHKTEAVLMLDPAFQKADAEATCKGICKTFGVTYIEDKPNSNIQSTSKVNEVTNTTKYIRVLVDSLNYRKSLSWDDSAVAGVTKKGDVFTVTHKYKVDTGYMYKLKSGYYITASSKYVESLTSL